MKGKKSGYSVFLQYCSCVCVQWLSHVQFFEVPWTVVHQATLSMELSRQEYWSGLPFPPPWDLPDPGIKTTSPTSPGLAGGFFTTSGTWEARYGLCRHQRKKILINHNADQFQTYLTKADSQCKIVVFLYIAKRLNQMLSSGALPLDHFLKEVWLHATKGESGAKKITCEFILN